MSALLLLQRQNRPVVDWSFLGASLPESLVLTRAGTGAYIGTDGLLRFASANMPRFNQQAVSGLPRGLLMEEQRQNKLRYSQDITAIGVWTYNRPLVRTINEPGAPDGTSTLNKWTRTETGPSYVLQQLTKSAVSQPFTTSGYVKKADIGTTLAVRLQGSYPNRVDCAFDLVNGTMGTPVTAGSGFSGVSATFTPIGNGFYRFTLTTATTDAGTAIHVGLSFNVSGSSQIDITDAVANSNGYLWGIQLEEGKFATSYIPTTDSAVTRPVDLLNTTAMPWFNPNEGTIYAEFEMFAYNTTNSRIVRFDNGSVNAIEGFVGNGTYNALVDTSVSGGVSSGALGAVQKMALAYKGGNNISAINGAFVSGGTFPTAALPSGITTLRFGNNEASTRPLNGHLRSFKYWNKAHASQIIERITL